MGYYGCVVDFEDTAGIVSVVAGCLFEVSFPDDAGVEWRWLNPSPELTLLAEEARRGRRHFRFRAEAAGAVAGSVSLRFAGTTSTEVVVHVAPERPADEYG